MKIVLAPDSFKGSLTAMKVSTIMKRAISEIDNHSDVTMKAMADGGEGALELDGKVKFIF